MENGPSLPLRLIVKTLLNCALVWLMATYMADYFHLTGGIPAIVIVGALITLMNIFVRPLLEILMFPFKLFATIIAIIGVNGGFVQLIHVITLKMDPSLIQLEILGGLFGWVIVAVIFGLANWMMKEMIKKK